MKQERYSLVHYLPWFILWIWERD